MEVVNRYWPLVAVESTPSWYAYTKRTVDILGTLTLLLLLLPVLIVCAILIVLDSPGPVLFRQERVGEGGRPFTFLKFRSMSHGTGDAPHRDFAVNFVRGQVAGQQTAHGTVFKLVADDRITRVGGFLRCTSLDELPQLWNVLLGEMSLVGPRPPVPYEVEHYQPAHLQRLSVKPGITGLWQVHGRSRTTFEGMVAMDLEYIERRSLGLDLWLLVATIPAVFRRSGAH